jgi:membrane associated rhomboid family serine protease
MTDSSTKARPFSPRASDLLYRGTLGAPWATIFLVATCVLVTLPLFVDPERFYRILGVGFCEEDTRVYWWHALVTPFVHGAGCGFPPTWFHIGINVSLFVFHGAIVERLLGSGRFTLLTLTCLVVQIGLKYVITDGRGHGASGMTWST